MMKKKRKKISHEMIVVSLLLLVLISLYVSQQVATTVVIPPPHVTEPKFLDGFRQSSSKPSGTTSSVRLKTEQEHLENDKRRVGGELEPQEGGIIVPNDDSSSSGGKLRAVDRKPANLANQGKANDEVQQVPATNGEAVEDSADANTSDTMGIQDFSACLLVMDDNHRLVEFLAYHSFVLPLNYVVIAVDPRSKTSPTPILDRFRRLLNMTIHEWNDKDFGMQAPRLPALEDISLTYINRQNAFLKECAIHMRRHNRTWVTFHDIDEYLTFNHPSSNLEEWEQKRTAERQNASFKIRRESGPRRPPSKPPPPITEYGSLGKYLAQEGLHPSIRKKSCIAVPRTLYGSQETNQTAPYSDVLDTLRYKFHGERDDHDTNGLGKVIMRMDKAKLVTLRAKTVKSPHRPFRTICPSAWVYDSNTLLRINHYIGSWEAYSFRDDARRGKERSRKAWERKSNTTSHTGDDFIGDWIYGFLRRHGKELAAEILEGAGLPKNYTNTDLKSWKYTGEKKLGWELMFQSQSQNGTNNGTLG